jgi:hypothetical protein
MYRPIVLLLKHAAALAGLHVPSSAIFTDFLLLSQTSIPDVRLPNSCLFLEAEFIGKIRLLGGKLPTSILAFAAILKI